jgi:hypothetical protein
MQETESEIENDERFVCHHLNCLKSFTHKKSRHEHEKKNIHETCKNTPNICKACLLFEIFQGQRMREEEANKLLKIIHKIQQSLQLTKYETLITTLSNKIIQLEQEIKEIKKPPNIQKRRFSKLHTDHPFEEAIERTSANESSLKEQYHEMYLAIKDRQKKTVREETHTIDIPKIAVNNKQSDPIRLSIDVFYYVLPYVVFLFLFIDCYRCVIR